MDKIRDRASVCSMSRLMLLTCALLEKQVVMSPKESYPTGVISHMATFILAMAGHHFDVDIQGDGRCVKLLMVVVMMRWFLEIWFLCISLAILELAM